MAKQIEGVFEKVLMCAKEEFCSKGFKDASLRTIASNAGTSTGSIYTRFHDKEGLFREIVQPAAQGLKEQFLNVQIDFHKKDAKVQMNEMTDYGIHSLMNIVDYIYLHFSEFDLLVNGSYGTEYSDFLDEIVDIEVEYTYKYMDAIGCKTLENGMITKDMLHIIATSYMNGIFETVRHKMSITEAKKYIGILYKYHRKGYEVIFGNES